MTMAETPNETSGALTDPMDRRSALKKAAAAGAIAWTAPMILSSTAHADHDPAGNGVCTPSCAPGAFTPTFSGRDGGTGQPGCDNDRAAFGVPGNANKFGVFKVGAPGAVSCPCSDVLSQVVISFPPGTVWSKSNTECAPFAEPIYAETYFDPNQPDLFAVAKTGAIGNGWYTPNNPICVSVGCPDEVGGDMVYRTCQFNISFYYDPNFAICSTFGAPLDVCIGQVGNCTVSCNHC
jgi:hypothetical protein